MVIHMQSPSTVIIDKPASVESALESIGLSKRKILDIASAACFARAEYLPNIDPVNYPGVRAYQEGTRQIRLATLPDGWKNSKFNNIELVFNTELGLMLGFQNVDLACSPKDPQAISARGEATKQLVSLPYQKSLFSDDTPKMEGSPEGAFPVVWFICVAAFDDRLQVEVSRPKPFDGDQFSGFYERIFVADEALELEYRSEDESVDEGGEEPEVIVTKKNNGHA